MVQRATSIGERTGSRIRLLRDRRNWSQKQLADFSDLSRWSINQAESGQADLRLSTLEKIALALEVRPSELLAD